MNSFITPDQLAAFGSECRRQGRKIVFTNGCFDLLHVGHVRYLEQARTLGDLLVVAINSDRSVSALKGPSRPLNCEDERAEVVAALRCVDAVTIFDDLRATAVIEKLRPAVYVKGGDYTIDSLDSNERVALEKCGSEVMILPLVPGRSTTALTKKMAR